jgi:peptidyl-prolyl cis-trans isomerase-like 1
MSSIAQRPKDVRLETSSGIIEIELYWDHAPKTCENVYQLAKSGYYNKTVFHRVIPGKLKHPINQ